MADDLLAPEARLKTLVAGVDGLHGQPFVGEQLTDQAVRRAFKRQPNAALIVFAGATPAGGGSDAGVVLECRWVVLVGVRAAGAPEKARAAGVGAGPGAGVLANRVIAAVHGQETEGFSPFRLEAVQTPRLTESDFFVFPLVFGTTAVVGG